MLWSINHYGGLKWEEEKAAVRANYKFDFLFLLVDKFGKIIKSNKIIKQSETHYIP